MTNIELLHVSAPDCHPQGVYFFVRGLPEDGTRVPKCVGFGTLYCVSFILLSASFGWYSKCQNMHDMTSNIKYS